MLSTTSVLTGEHGEKTRAFAFIFCVAQGVEKLYQKDMSRRLKLKVEHHPKLLTTGRTSPSKRPLEQILSSYVSCPGLGPGGFGTVLHVRLKIMYLTPEAFMHVR